jgi:hypothetical protein
MAILPNPRHEKFAELLAQGKTAREAYVLCGYHDNRHNAARLKSSETVRRRVLELSEAAAAAHEITIAGVLKELDDAITLAKERGMPNALINAAQLRSRLGGLLIDKAEIQVSNGGNEFPDCREFSEVSRTLANNQLSDLTNSRWLPIDESDRTYLAGLWFDHLTQVQSFLNSVERRPLLKEGMQLLTEADVKPKREV